MTRFTLLCLLFLAAALFPVGPAPAAEGDSVAEDGLDFLTPYELSAGIGVSTEFNDNVHETASHKTADMVNRVKPQFALLREGGRVKTDISYRGDYRYHVKGSRRDDYSHFLNASLLGEVWENLFFISIAENLQPVHRDTTRGELVDGDSTRDLVNRNVFSVSPFFRLQPTDRTSLLAGYTFTDTRHSRAGEEERSSFLPTGKGEYSFTYRKNQQHSVFGDIEHLLTDKWSVTTGFDVLYRDADAESSQSESTLTRYQAYVGSHYEVSEDLMVSARVGPSYSKPKNGSSKLKPFIDANLAYTVGRTVFAMGYSTSFEEDSDTGESLRRETYSASAAKTFDRASLRLEFSYNIYDEEVNRGSEKRTLRPSVLFSYELSERLSFLSRYYANIYEDKKDGETTHHGSYGLKYLLDESIWISLTHSLKAGEPNNSGSYFVNKCSVELYVGF